MDEKLLPEALKKCGYQTEMVGKWHLGLFQEDYLPQNRGFDRFLGFYTGGQNYVTHEKCYLGMCGYDFREAEKDKPEIIRYDYNGTYSYGCQLIIFNLVFFFLCSKINSFIRFK